MKRLLPALALILPLKAFAFYCPTNNEILLLHASTANVIKTCGEPTHRKSFERTFVLESKWIYDKEENGSKVTAILHFIGERAEDITLERTPNFPECQADNSCETEKSTATSYSGCTQLVITGNTKRYVRNACGEPNVINIMKEERNEYTEFVYTGTNDSLNLLFFKNDQLIQQRPNGN